MLLVLALFIWGYNIYQVRMRMAPKPIVPAQSGDRTAKSGSYNSFIRSTPYNPSLRDPFEAPGPAGSVPSGKSKAIVPALPAAPIEPPPYTINGLMWDAKSPSAFLADTRSGEVMMVNNGTLWGELKVITITQSSIKVKYKGKDFELR